MPALTISRRTGEKLMIGDDIVVELGRVQSDGKARITITAPGKVNVHREEVYLDLQTREGRKDSGRPTPGKKVLIGAGPVLPRDQPLARPWKRRS